MPERSAFLAACCLPPASAAPCGGYAGEPGKRPESFPRTFCNPAESPGIQGLRRFRRVTFSVGILHERLTDRRADCRRRRVLPGATLRTATRKSVKIRAHVESPRRPSRTADPAGQPRLPAVLQPAAVATPAGDHPGGLAGPRHDAGGRPDDRRDLQPGADPAGVPLAAQAGADPADPGGRRYHLLHDPVRRADGRRHAAQRHADQPGRGRRPAFAEARRLPGVAWRAAGLAAVAHAGALPAVHASC